MTDKLHRLFTVDDGIHYVQAWIVEDYDALALLVVTADDVGRVARVLDDHTFWVLVEPPAGEVFAVWRLISSVPSSNQPQSIGDAEAGSSLQYARGDHVHAHGDQAGGTLHADVVAGGASGFMTGAQATKLDAIDASDATPVPVGVAAAGTSGDYARGDHEHSLFTWTVADTAAREALSVDAGDVGRWAFQTDYGTAWLLVGIDDGGEGSDVPIWRTFTASEEDPEAVGSFGNPGGSPEFARSDHVHAHGDQGGGSLHAAAVADGAAGFMTGAQAAKLAAIDASDADPAFLLDTPDPGVSADYSRADHVHPKGAIYTWFTTDEADRLALVVTTGDVGKVAYQEDTKTFWFLADVPTEGADVWRTMITADQADAIDDNTAAIALKANREFAINAQTGTTYTFAATDDLVTLTNAASITATLPPNASVPIPVGRTITIVQGGAGQVTVAPGAGVTTLPALTLKTRAVDSPLTLVKVATDTWRVWGDAAAT